MAKDRDGQESSGWYELPAIRSNDSQASPQRMTSKGPRGQNSTAGLIWSRVLETLRLRRRLQVDPEGRRVPLRLSDEPLIDERTEYPYISNRIRTSRYTVWNFVPRQLVYQFSRLANAYFLVIAILQMIPGFSTTGQYTTIIPLLIFVSITIAKEGYDDFKRYRLDKEENARPVKVLRTRVPNVARRTRGRRASSTASDTLLKPRTHSDDDGAPDEHWTGKQWGDLQVGDVVKLASNEEVPADIVLLDIADQDVAYVDTRALDGETTLKSKQISAALKGKGLENPQVIASGGIMFILEHPNQDLYNFDGTVVVDGHESLPLNVDNIVYRGCEIKNTRCLVGMVINTGEDTKIRMNANKDPSEKRPALEKFVNLIVIFLAIYMMVISFVLYVGFKVYWNASDYPWYLMRSFVDDADIIIGFIIQFSNVVPMSLIMAIEVVRLNLGYLLSSDLDMYHAESDTPAGCNSNNILDDLGQIGYVFSDKTGTLTDNIMKFRQVSVAGTSWWHKNSEDSHEGASPVPKPGELTTDDLVAYIRRDPDSAFSKAGYQYLLALAVCHTCLPEIDPETGEITDFQAASPDELALVRAARDMGILVVERTTTHLTLQMSEDISSPPRRQKFEVLDVIEFNSKRKRMSIIVRRPDGRIWLVCKGADATVLPLLENPPTDTRRESLHRHGRGSTSLSRRSRSREFSAAVYDELGINGPDIFADPVDPSPYSYSSVNRHDVPEGLRHFHPIVQSPTDDNSSLRACMEHIDNYAKEGLRTLIFAERFLDEDEYNAWKREYRDAQVSLQDRQSKVEQVGEKVEHSLSLLGASGVEDKLQQGVPETIDRLRRADIKIWMLTGDKRETAVNIAHSSRICTPETAIFQLDVEEGDLEWQISDVMDAPERQYAVHTALVIDGQTLTALEQPDAGRPRETFFRTLIPTVDSVICCRASPAQKALLVTSIRDEAPLPQGTSVLRQAWWWASTSARSHRRPLTLAVGDGANDLAMITSANVGVGISGREGQQAARVADVSVGQFRFLGKLLLVHGRWNYHRVTRFVLGNFWKETLFWTPAALFQIAAGFTGTSLYESRALTVYGFAFTSLAAMALGAFEKDLGARVLMAVPELYRYGRSAAGLNWGVFLAWTANALLSGTAISFIAWAGYGGWYTETSDDNNLYAIGTVVFISCMIWTNVKLLIIEMHYKTWLVLAIFWFEVALIWFFHVVLGYVFPDLVISPYAVVDGFIYAFGRDAAWWATLVLILATLWVVEIGVASVRQRLAGSSLFSFQSKQQLGGTQGQGRPKREWDPRLWREIEQDARRRRRLDDLCDDNV